MTAHDDKPRVLLVGHDREVRETVKRLVRDDVVFLEATSVSGTLEAFETNSPDCTFLSNGLPDGDAIELLERIDTDRFPVVMLNGDDGQTDATSAIRRGAQDCLSKADLTHASIARSLRFCMEHKRLRERALAAESRYRDLFHEAPVMYVITQEDELPIVHDCNRLFAATLGLGRSAIIGKSLFDFYDERSAPRSRDIQSLRAGPHECALITKDGRSIPVLSHAVPERGVDGEVQGARIMFVNIVGRKEAENALRRREAEMRTLLDAIPDVLIKLIERDETLQIEAVYAGSHEDQEVVASHTALPEVAISDFKRHVKLAIRGGPPVRFDYELDVQGTVRTFEARVVRLTEAEFVAIIRDQTDARELELKLLRSQRLEAVGRLAGGVAHDFNNFLTVITGNAELALLDLEGKDDPNVGVYREIVYASGRAADLTRQLLAFSRQQILKPRVIDLNELVARSVKLLRRLIGEDIRLPTQLTNELPPIKADPGQIEQILMNLAVNARDAMPDGGEVSFETEAVELSEPEPHGDFTIPPGRYVRLTVIDTGIGMDDETRARAFEPFFTTKEHRQGTGLGLATVYGIVKQSGGYIVVESAPTCGTAFGIFLPCADETEIEPFHRTSPAPVPGHGEAIVFVEDDSGVLGLARSILERGGYRVAAFQKGDEAVRFIKDNPDGIDLLATDIVLPGMSGPTVAEAALEARPNLPVLYLSGYADDVRVRQAILEADMLFLEKPFSRASLLSAVCDALKSRS